MVRWTENIYQFLAEEVVPSSKLVGEKWPHHDIVINKFSRSQIYKRHHFFSSRYSDLELNIAWAEFVSGVNSKSEELYKEVHIKINDNGYSSFLGILILRKHQPKDTYLFSVFIELLAKSRYF